MAVARPFGFEIDSRGHFTANEIQNAINVKFRSLALIFNSKFDHKLFSFLKIFEDLFTITLFSKMKIIYEMNIILNFSGCKLSSRIDFKTLWPRNGHADSLGVDKKKFNLQPEQEVEIVWNWIGGLLNGH